MKSPKRSGEYLFEIIMRRHELKSNDQQPRWLGTDPDRQLVQLPPCDLDLTNDLQQLRSQLIGRCVSTHRDGFFQDGRTVRASVKSKHSPLREKNPADKSGNGRRVRTASLRHRTSVADVLSTGRMSRLVHRKSDRSLLVESTRRGVL